MKERHFLMQDRNLVNVNLTSEMKTSFIDYAMSVIVARALPDVRDGLKPVHRRILYGMNELGVTPEKPHKKSARITGDVMGKYHPHGDSSIYEAMVRMAQWWSYRYMLVDGHGNFGSMDGDGAAAQRYTEARMSKIALEMLRDINKNTGDYISIDLLFIGDIDFHTSLSTIQWGKEHVTSPCDAKDVVASQGVISLSHLLSLFHRTSTIIQSSIIQPFEDRQIHGYFWN